MDNQLLRCKEDVACTVKACFNHVLRDSPYSEALKAGLVINNTFVITDNRNPPKKYKVTVEEIP